MPRLEGNRSNTGVNVIVLLLVLLAILAVLDYTNVLDLGII
jgi:hypothetical protein